MIFLKKIFSTYIKGSIHVALSVYALVRITELYFDMPYNENLNYFIFYGSVIGYNFVKYIHLILANKKSFLIKHFKLEIIISIIALLATIFYANNISKSALFYMIPLCILTIMYALPFLNNNNLRNIPTVKIIVIAFVWSAISVILPLLNNSKIANEIKTLLFLQRMLFVIALTIPFDIRDFNNDNTTLQTLPQRIGVNNTKKLGILILIITLIIEFYISDNTTYKLTYLLITLITMLFIVKANTNQKTYYSSFFVEGIPILWLLLLVTFK